MTQQGGRPRIDALMEVAARLARSPSREASGRAVVDAIGSGDLVCLLLAVDGDSASGLAISLGADSGSRLDLGTAERLLEHVFPVDGITVLRDVVRRRAPYRGLSGALSVLAAMPSVVRQGVDVVKPADQFVVAAPVEARDRVVGVLVAWGSGCDADTLGPVEMGAGLLSLAWDQGATEQRACASAATRPSRAAALSALAPLLRPGRLRAALQPIVRLHDGVVMGWEALCRFEPTEAVPNPDALFAAAAAAGKAVEVDTICLRAGLAEGLSADPAPLFLNISIATLMTEDIGARLDALLAEARLTASRVVLELSEREPVSDMAGLQRVTTSLRTAGFRFAVDDAGSGHASLRIVAEIRPDFIKIDRSLIHDVATDKARRALVVALLSFGGHIGSRVIAEGVETEVERGALTALGVQYGQGFHLGMPVMCAPPAHAANVVAVDAAWFGEQTVLGFGAGAPPVETSIRIDTPELLKGSGRRRSLARALSDAARALQSEHDRARILGVIAEQLVQVVPVEEIAIYAADYETYRFVPLLATGPEAAAILADSFALDSGLTGWAFAAGVPQNVRDTSTHPASRQVPGTSVVEESLLLLPMVAGDSRLGIINCYRLGAGRFTAAELNAASLFAHMAASAWRNAQLYSELLDAAMTDPLTSLLNTRWLHETGARDLARSVRLGSPHAVLLLDLDHFKQVNDSCGHAIGDTVLRRVSRTLRALVRKSDAVVRFGGEEFLILLPDTETAGALMLAEKIREAVSRLPLPDSCTLVKLTTSIGVALHPECGSDLDLLIRAADKALYEAKRDGRNQVVLAPCEQPIDLSTARALREQTQAAGPLDLEPVVLSL
jgi:diguanylate cyclase (GGDEF)-like protein